MNNDELLAPKPDCKLTEQQARLLLLYGNAAKAATLAETTEDAKRWNDIALLHSRQFDYAVRSEAVTKLLPSVLKTKRHADIATQFVSTFRYLCEQIKKVFGKQDTGRPPLVTKTDAQRSAYYRRPKRDQETETNTRPVGKEPHLAA